MKTFCWCRLFCEIWDRPPWHQITRFALKQTLIILTTIWTLLPRSFPHFTVTSSVYNVSAITELPCRDKLSRALSFPICFPSSCLPLSRSKVNCVPSDDSFLRLLISPRPHTDHHCSLQPCRQLTSRQNKLCLLCEQWKASALDNIWTLLLQWCAKRSRSEVS